MGILATNTDAWAIAGTTLGTLLLLLPGVVYAWYALEKWIGDDESYAKVISSINN